MSIIQIATFFWLIAWILLIARTSVLIAECFFDDMWARLKMVSGHTAGPEGRSGGRSEARSAERRPQRSPEGPAVCPDTIFNLAHISSKNIQLLSTEVRATQQNPRYSAKNNVAMRSIATFMTKLN